MSIKTFIAVLSLIYTLKNCGEFKSIKHEKTFTRSWIYIFNGSL